MWKQLTEPAVEPITLAEVKIRLGITDTIDDDDINAGIRAARELAEQYTGRAFVRRTIEGAFDSFCDEMLLPVQPLYSLNGITYVDADGVVQNLDSSIYYVDTYYPIHRIVRAYGKDWPTTRTQTNAVIVNYEAGYSTDASGVPESVKQAMFLAVGHWVRFQAQAESGVGPTRMPMQFYDLLDSHKVWRAA